MITVCHKDSGRPLLSAANVVAGDKASRLLAEGHLLVKGKPPEDRMLWSGGQWVPDTDLRATFDQHKRRQVLASIDGDMPRITEDLVDLLIANGVINLFDLPAKAVLKLTARKKAREDATG